LNKKRYYDFSNDLWWGVIFFYETPISWWGYFKIFRGGGGVTRHTQGVNFVGRVSRSLHPAKHPAQSPSFSLLSSTLNKKV
ncbi:hypothetical protein ACVGXU_03705, partial [Enterobacter hormaechei]